MAVNSISSNQFYGNNETKRAGDVVHYLQDKGVYTHVDQETRNKWQVLFDHNRPVRSTGVFPLVGFFIGVGLFTSLKIGFSIPSILFLFPGSNGVLGVGALIYDVVKYREGKRVADQEIPRDRFEEMIRQIKESLEPQKVLYDSIQLKAQEDQQNMITGGNSASLQ